MHLVVTGGTKTVTLSIARLLGGRRQDCDNPRQAALSLSDDITAAVDILLVVERAWFPGGLLLGDSQSRTTNDSRLACRDATRQEPCPTNRSR